MSADSPQTTPTGGLHNVSFILQKPENLGTESKPSVCSKLGVMTYLEIQRGKEGMKCMSYHKDLGGTAGCCKRVSEQNFPIPY